ncbi:uncharacterized protein BJ171DRAFT_11671 [Polychytrium aggregatum]|uniref:uncharacterized protein n=1 Tax=Polychytrium aggregatum TaxID=110093 RepID=UPI0022FE307E|nr:uncharacterized protein BJ171DRAFT_11671 [Polychytrium aggregatum]KAI9206555.1 hypothetical protein BJ171DRAFT_11671 [Polychytrium aggregatum]
MNPFQFKPGNRSNCKPLMGGGSLDDSGDESLQSDTLLVGDRITDTQLIERELPDDAFESEDEHDPLEDFTPSSSESTNSPVVVVDKGKRRAEYCPPIGTSSKRIYEGPQPPPEDMKYAELKEIFKVSIPDFDRYVGTGMVMDWGTFDLENLHLVLQGLYCFVEGRRESFVGGFESPVKLRIPRSSTWFKSERHLWEAVANNAEFRKSVMKCERLRSIPTDNVRHFEHILKEITGPLKTRYIQAKLREQSQSFDSGVFDFVHSDVFALFDPAMMLSEYLPMVEDVDSTHRHLLIFRTPDDVQPPLRILGAQDRLLPLERFQIEMLTPSEPRTSSKVSQDVFLHLHFCTFSTVGDWPLALSNVVKLAIEYSTSYPMLNPDVSFHWSDFPSMPFLTDLSLGISGLQKLGRMPEVLSGLEMLDLSGCTSLESIVKMPSAMDKLKVLRLPTSLETTAGLPKSMKELELLTGIVNNRNLTRLSDFPFTLPRLKNLEIPPGTTLNLFGMPLNLPAMTTITGLENCEQLVSLLGITKTVPQLLELKLPKDVVSLEPLADATLPRLASLDLSRCINMVEIDAHLENVVTLRSLALPENFKFLNELNKLPRTNLHKLDLSKCTRLRSFAGMPEIPNLQHIVMPRSFLDFAGLNVTSLVKLDISKSFKFPSYMDTCRFVIQQLVVNQNMHQCSKRITWGENYRRLHDRPEPVYIFVESFVSND